MAQGWLRRAYPVHLLAIIIIFRLEGIPKSWTWWRSLPADLLLTYTWNPLEWCGTLRNIPAWFLSTLLALGFLFPFIYASIQKLNIKDCVVALTMCYALTSVPTIMQHLLGINIFNTEDDATVHFRMQAMNHPFSQWPNYVAGMILAQLFMQIGGDTSPSWLAK